MKNLHLSARRFAPEKGWAPGQIYTWLTCGDFLPWLALIVLGLAVTGLVVVINSAVRGAFPVTAGLSLASNHDRAKTRPMFHLKKIGVGDSSESDKKYLPFVKIRRFLDAEWLRSKL